MAERSFQYSVIAGYRFFDLKDPQKLRVLLQALCSELQMKGTIILSHEGLNAYASGSNEAIGRFKNELHGQFGVPPIDFKEHQTSRDPWRQMIVKVKKEIITMGVSDIRPMDFTGEALPPAEFKKWLDEGRDMAILDTRNTYEVELGKFRGAKDLRTRSFKEFVEKARELPAELKEKPLVMYCTGGIRCEKASALLLKHYGFKEVFQLEGGILNYFKKVGGDHYEGECLVFDRRVGIDPSESETNYCLNCKVALSPADYTHPEYVPFKVCPHCYEQD